MCARLTIYPKPKNVFELFAAVAAAAVCLSN